MYNTHTHTFKDLKNIFTGCPQNIQYNFNNLTQEPKPTNNSIGEVEALHTGDKVNNTIFWGTSLHILYNEHELRS
jgi:hypothetical protein